MIEVFLGLFSGIVFGFIIQRIGATNPDKMARAHLMLEPAIPQFMLLAIVFSAAGLLGLQAKGIDNTVILPTSLIATGLAAAIFGIGWGIAGYCPGTCWAAVGEGRMDAVYAFLGGLLGTAVFAHFHEWIIPLLYSPTNIGQLTLTDITGSRYFAILILLFLFLGGAWTIGKYWGHDKN
jgi:hypothetical protein